MPHATAPSLGLQALILCGPGESLSTFTSTPKDFCKALIPIANRPMIWYPLDWCYRMGIHNITLITPPESKAGLEGALATTPSLTSLPTPKPEVLAPAQLTQTTGTGELLRLPEVQAAITSDFVVLPCDLVSELDGGRIVQQWMTLNPLPLSTRQMRRKGGLAVFYPTYGLEGISQKKDETDFIATAPLQPPSAPPPAGSLRADIETLVMAMPTDTLNDKTAENEQCLGLRTALPHRYGRVRLRTKHRDAHVYVFPQWVKEFARGQPAFDSISEDVLGWWAKAQWQTGLGEKLGLDEVLRSETRAPSDLADSTRLDEEEEEMVDVAQLSSTQISFPARPSTTPTAFASRVRAQPPPTTTATTPLEIPPLLAYVQPNPLSSAPGPEQPLIRRVDTAPALLSVSLYLARQPTTHALAHEHKVHPTATLGPQSRVSQEDSLVGQNVTIGARSIVRESVVGANCEIGSNVRLTRCLLMDGVSVGDGVQLTGCVVGRRARLAGVPADGGNDELRTRLTDVEVAPHFHVEAGREADKGEKLMAFDTEGFDDDDGVLDEEEDDEQGESEEV